LAASPIHYRTVVVDGTLDEHHREVELLKFLYQ
jgi:hypothetical protein